MLSFNVPLPDIQGLLLVFLRVSCILFSVPLFESRNIPIALKAGLAIAISFLLFPVVNVNPSAFNTNLMQFTLRVFSEVAVGVLIGLSVRLIFTAIQFAGQLIGYQMGFAIANVMDPATSAQIPILSQINNLFAMLVFFSINAHHWFVKALVDSFDLIPLFEFRFSQSLYALIMQLSADIFTIAIKLGAPIIVAMLLANVALGLIARTVPQMHILIVAMPFKIMLGFWFLMAMSPYLMAFLVDLFGKMGKVVFNLIRVIT